MTKQLSADSADKTEWWPWTVVANLKITHCAGTTLETRFEVENIIQVSINLSKLKLVKMTFKNSVVTSKRTPHFTITKINWLTLFKEIIAV
jgi:hypothetical protein